MVRAYQPISEIQATICIVKHYINIYANENFCTKIHVTLHENNRFKTNTNFYL